MGANARDNLAERAVVDVEHPFPQYLLEGKPIFGMLIEIIVEQS